jgi:hypothetical protein
MGDDMAVKLNKYHKPRLIEAIVVCMARIDLLEAGNVRSDGNVRAELRELKAAVFANVSNAVITQDTQDVLDSPNVGWDDIHKLARGASWHEEQNPAPPTTPQPQPHAQQTPSQLALQDAKLAKLADVKATRIAQERTQEATQEAERIRQDATADSRKAKKEERYGPRWRGWGSFPRVLRSSGAKSAAGSPERRRSRASPTSTSTTWSSVWTRLTRPWQPRTGTSCSTCGRRGRRGHPNPHQDLLQKTRGGGELRCKASPPEQRQPEGGEATSRGKGDSAAAARVEHKSDRP